MSRDASPPGWDLDQLDRQTDFGNAERFVMEYGSQFRYCHAWRSWLAFDGRRWAVDDRGLVEAAAKRTIRSLHVEALTEDDDRRRAQLIRHALNSESHPRLMALVRVAQSDLPLTPDALDRDGMLLNVLNGTLDLRTGELRPHRAADLLSKVAGAAYDPAATAPTWLRFLDRVLAGDADRIAFLQRALGYSLTGSTGEQVLLFLIGPGANGKSVFLELVSRLLGDYAVKADFSTFLATRREGPRNDLAALAGARLVAAAEAGEGQRFDEAMVKQLTGGDTVTARKLYGEFFSFRPAFKVWLAANHKPQVRSVGEAIWRRLRLIPFTVTIPETERDPALLEKLAAEVPGILAWAVEGCLAWQREGLGQPPAVRDATAEYRSEMDLLGAFLEERCVLADGARETAGALYAAYRAWAGVNEETVLPKSAFGLRLSERGLVGRKGSKGRRLWLGIRLREGGGEVAEGGTPSGLSPYARTQGKDYEVADSSRHPPPPEAEMELGDAWEPAA